MKPFFQPLPILLPLEKAVYIKKNVQYIICAILVSQKIIKIALPYKNLRKKCFKAKDLDVYCDKSAIEYDNFYL